MYPQKDTEPAAKKDSNCLLPLLESLTKARGSGSFAELDLTSTREKDSPTQTAASTQLLAMLDRRPSQDRYSLFDNDGIEVTPLVTGHHAVFGSNNNSGTLSGVAFDPDGTAHSSDSSSVSDDACFTHVLPDASIPRSSSISVIPTSGITRVSVQPLVFVSPPRSPDPPKGLKLSILNRNMGGAVESPKGIGRLSLPPNRDRPPPECPQSSRVSAGVPLLQPSLALSLGHMPLPLPDELGVSQTSRGPAHAAHAAHPGHQAAPGLACPAPMRLRITESDGAVSPHTEKAAKIERFSKIMSRITSFLYLSSVEVATNWDEVRRNKVTHIINCCSEACDCPFMDRGIVYLHLKLRDTATEVIEPLFLETINFIDSARKSGGTTLVHCYQGVSRSATLIIAYLMWANDLNYEAAYSHTRACRSVVSPNSGFVFQLVGWWRRRHADTNCAHISRQIGRRNFIPGLIDTDAAARMDSAIQDIRGSIFVQCRPPSAASSRPPLYRLARFSALQPDIYVLKAVDLSIIKNKAATLPSGAGAPGAPGAASFKAGVGYMDNRFVYVSPMADATYVFIGSGIDALFTAPARRVELARALARQISLLQKLDGTSLKVVKVFEASVRGAIASVLRKGGIDRRLVSQIRSASTGSLPPQASLGSLFARRRPCCASTHGLDRPGLPPRQSRANALRSMGTLSRLSDASHSAWSARVPQRELAGSYATMSQVDSLNQTDISEGGESSIVQAEDSSAIFCDALARRRTSGLPNSRPGSALPAPDSAAYKDSLTPPQGSRPIDLLETAAAALGSLELLEATGAIGSGSVSSVDTRGSSNDCWEGALTSAVTGRVAKLISCAQSIKKIKIWGIRTELDTEVALMASALY